MTDIPEGEHGEHIGDGVYASFDGYHIWLETLNQPTHNKVALEPSVFDRLIDYRDRIVGVPND